MNKKILLYYTVYCFLLLHLTGCPSSSDNDGTRSNNSSLPDAITPNPVQENIPEIVPLTFLDMQWVEFTGRQGHESLYPIIGDPIFGTEVIAKIILTAQLQYPVLALESLNGDIISEFDLELDINGFLPSELPLITQTNDSQQAIISYYSKISIPPIPFSVIVKGLGGSGGNIEIITEKIYFPNTIGLGFTDMPFSVTPGSNTRFGINVTNFGEQEDEFTLHVSDSNGYIQTQMPIIITVPATEIKTIYVDLLPPADTIEFTDFNLSVVAQSHTNLTSRNYAYTNILIE